MAADYIQLCQSLVILYTLAIVALFTYHACKRPRISDSVKRLKCEQLKYLLIWLPFMVFILAVEIVSLTLAFMVNKYWNTWIDLL